MKSRPNILWIVTTQWRAQACGYAGDPNARTPHLDALAAESVNFAEAVTPHPFGPQARAALLTGVRSPANGVREYFDALPADARTIAHALRDRGYATAFFGKWGVGRRDATLPPVSEGAARIAVPPAERGGFETWDGFEGGFQLNDPWRQGRHGDSPRRETGYQSDAVCAWAAEYLREAARGDRPWFAIVSLEAPHPPYAAPAAGIALRAAEAIVLAGNVPRGGEVEAKARRELAGYHAHIEATDRAIGRVLLPVVARADTVVVFTSVHGDMHGAHGLFRKGWPHEERVRVPLLVRRPGEAACVSREPVSLADLPGMTLAWAEGRPAAGTRPFAAISMPAVVALPHQCDRVWSGVRTPERKLVVDAAGAPWLFFDLERDPMERENLVDRPERADEIAWWRQRWRSNA
jgi:arylsulfatase A-like enzyme